MRRIVFFIVMSIFYVVTLPYLGIVYLIGQFNRKARVHMAYHFNRLTGWLIFAIAGAKFNVEGLEHIPTDSAAVFVGNHRSMLDIPLLMRYSRRPINFIGKKSILKWPFVGWWMRAMDGLFLDRKNARQGLKTILSGIERIKNGESFAIYPEGTRSRTDELLPFKQGSLKLASKSGAPVIPIAVRGTAAVFENNHINLKPETIYFRIGEPIDLSTLSKEDQLTSASYVREIIDTMYQDLVQLEAADSRNK